MHVVITIESTTIMSSIPAFQHELTPMFFHMDSIRKFISLFKVGGLLPMLSSSFV